MCSGMSSEREGHPASERPSTRGAPHGSASRSPDQALALFDDRREEFASAPAARAAGTMRVARAQGSPWDAPNGRELLGTAKCLAGLSVSRSLGGQIIPGQSRPKAAKRELISATTSAGSGPCAAKP